MCTDPRGRRPKVMRVLSAARFIKKRLTFVSYPRRNVALDTLQVLFCAKIADLPASGRKA
jgi:hypothetical protein